MPSLTLKPTHKAVTAYYDSLAKFEKLGIKHETAAVYTVQLEWPNQQNKCV
jgi:hypothetical protein